MKLAVVLALSRDAELLILDEPTLGLDAIAHSWVGVAVRWAWPALGLVRYLRAGMRPSADQNVFSAG